MLIKQILKDWGLEALILFLFVWIIIPYGPGLTFDSISFFDSGQHFLKDGHYVHLGADGEYEFAAHRFPLYPILLGLFNYGQSAVIAFQIALFVGTLLTFRWFLRSLNVPKYFLLLLACTHIILCYYCVWTEGLYGLLFLLLLVLLKKEEDYRPLYALAIVVALLCLTRMVGVVVAISLFGAYFMEKRNLRGLTLSAIGLICIVAWTFLGTYHLGNTARPLSEHLVTWNDLKFMVTDLGRWLTPSEIDWIPLIVGSALIIFPAILMIKNWKSKAEAGVLFWFCGIHFYLYILFLIGAKSFIDASIPFGSRTLFPLVLNFIAILAICQSSSVFTQRAKDKMRYIFPKLAILVVVLNAYSLWLIRENGVGYNSKAWLEFPFITELEYHEAEAVYTNDQAALFIYGGTDSNPKLMPEKLNMYSEKVNATYHAEFDLMLHDIKENPGTEIIWIRNGITGGVYPSYEELREHPDLEVIYDDWLCLILRAR